MVNINSRNIQGRGGGGGREDEVGGSERVKSLMRGGKTSLVSTRKICIMQYIVLQYTLVMMRNVALLCIYLYHEGYIYSY